MAKVESVNRSSSFYVNNSSFPDLKFGLEDSSPECNFDISLLLCDNETRQKNQHIDNDNRDDCKNNHDSKKGRSSPLTSLKTESLKLTSLTENQAKKNKMLPELSFDKDFNLADLLSNDDYPNNAKNIDASKGDNFFDFLLTDDHNPSVNKVSGVKNDNMFDFLLKEDHSSSVSKTSYAQNDNLLDFLVTEEDNPIVCKTSGAKNDISFDDLSQWMNSSIAQTSDSSKLSPSDHFSGDGSKSKLENISSVSLDTETKDVDKSESTHKVSDIDLENLLGEVSISTSETTDSIDTAGNSERNSKKSESTDETSDNDYLPDVDLTFCIKKNSKNDFSFYGNSPETVDSGFDESDFIPDKFSCPFEGKFFYKDVSPTGSGYKNKAIGKVKQSLFSRAISAKPKIDDSRKLKLKNVMKELLKGSTPLLCCDSHINLKESQRVIDHTDEHVVISSYLKFGDER